MIKEDTEGSERKTKRARKANIEQADNKKMKCIINVKGSDWMVNDFPSIRKAMFSIAQTNSA